MSKHHLFFTEPPEPMVRAAERLRLMSAWRHTIREPVLRYQREILKKHHWLVAEQFAGAFEGPIRSPRLSHMLSEEHLAIYREQCAAARQTIGLGGGDSAYCPLAQAERLLTKAQSMVLRELGKESGLAFLVKQKHSLSSQERTHWLESALVWAKPFMRSQAQHCEDVLGADETDDLRGWCAVVDEFKDAILA